MKLSIVVLFSFILVSKYHFEKSKPSRNASNLIHTGFNKVIVNNYNFMKTWSRFKATSFKQGQSSYYYVFSNSLYSLLLGFLLFSIIRQKKLSYSKNYYRSGVSPP